MARILVVDDSELVREALSLLLSHEGHQVDVAADGVSGLLRARECRPDLILCDVVMPRKDGYEVLEDLRSTPETALIPFIFLTVKDSATEVRSGMSLGADDYVSKTLDDETLLTAVRTRLSRSQAISKKLESLETALHRAIPHELRTALQGVIGFSDLLSEPQRFSHDEVAHMGKAIHRSAQRIVRLVENNLLVAHTRLLLDDPDRERWRSSLTPVSSRDIVAAAARAKVSEYGRDDDLVLNILEEGIRADPEHLERIVAELVDNACKFSKEGSMIVVETGVADGRWRMTVRDHGVGVVPEELATLGRYTQLHRLLREQQGVGLGLTLVWQLVLLYGGTLLLTSPPRGGLVVMAQL